MDEHTFLSSRQNKLYNCNKFYCNLTFCKLNTYLILTSACFGLVEQNASTDKSFFKDFTCREVTPWSANIRACAEIVVESECLETHYIFVPQQTIFLMGGRVDFILVRIR